MPNRKYTDQQRKKALSLSYEIGINNAAKILQIPYYTLAGWRREKQNVFPPTDRPAEKPATDTNAVCCIKKLEHENAILRQKERLLIEVLALSCESEKHS